MNDLQLFTAILQSLDEGAAAVLCTILESSGSTPRAAGARMAVFPGGGTVGTVGGGAVEQLVQQAAAEVLQTGRTCVRRYDHGSAGMLCGGSATICCQYLDAADRAAVQALCDLLRAGSGAVLSLDLAQTPPKMTVRSLAAPFPQDFAAPVLENGRYSEWISPAPQALLFGGGHVGQALAAVLAGLDFQVTVFDDRPEIAVPERFPAARRVLLGSYQNIAETLSITPRDYVVVMTAGHTSDFDVLSQALACHPCYIGCLGSRAKTAALQKRLADRGFSAAEIAAIHLPIGLPIRAQTPAEIAVSIAAELIQTRRSAASGA